MAASKRGKYSRQRAARKSGSSKEQPEEGFILRVIDGPNEGKEYFFDQEATIGRTEGNSVLIVEPGISRNHARVFEELGAYMLEDLGSGNGSRLNGEKIEAPEVLRDGDYITLSQTTFQFSVLNAIKGEITAETRLGDIEGFDKTGESQKPPITKRLLGTKRRKIILIVALLLIAGGVAYKFLAKRGRIAVFDQSDKPLAYSDDDAFFNAVFGYGKYDRTHKDRAIVTFEYLGGRATLQYGAWGVDKVGEVKILLNGEKISQVPLTMRRWLYGLKVVLPRDKLKKGKTNELVFDNVRNPPNSDPWSICYVQVIQEAIPPPNPKEARHRFELAKKSWEDREVEAGNAYNALVGFKKARDLLEGLAEKPELYQEAVDFVAKTDKELTRHFQEGLFSFRRAQKLEKDASKARLVLLRTLRYFRKDDFRYRELKRYLDAMAEAR
jgi:pSer/pThr/pTyr-binding forkhead associated (FHA) protein